MKAKKYNRFKLFALCSLLGFASCNDFDEMNIDPYAPIYDISVIGGTAEGIDIDYTLSDAAMESIRAMESAIGSVFGNFVYEGAYNDYQITTNLTHDIYSAYFANNVAGFQQNSPTYSYNDGWSASRWRHFYDDRTIGEYSQLLKTFYFCDKEYYHNAFYITRIYYAFLISMQTDTYGDIPLEYYVKGMVPPSEKVNYMPQEKVYETIFALLDQAIDQLGKTPTGKQYNLGDYDKCYGGDVNQWLRFANTLRLRLALRISNINPSYAEQQGVAALTHPAGLLKDDADNMKLTPKYSYNDGNENIYTLLYEWSANVLMSQDMEMAYKNQSTILDPRCEILWWRPTSLDDLNAKDGPKESDKDFKGMPIGELPKGKTSAETYSPSRVLLTQDQHILDPLHWWCKAREIVWLGYAESRFLLAEAALRGWQGTGKSAKDYYLDGIRASMEYYQISQTKGQAAINDYIDGLKFINVFDNGSKEEQLEQIITQKWIAVFPNGNEGWAEFRRTDYPALANILQNTSSDVPQGKFIKRVRYPDNESSNPNKPSALQGDRVWWDVADTNNDNGARVTPNNFRN